MSQSPQTIGAYQVPLPTKRDLFSISYWTLVIRRLNAIILMEPARVKKDGPLMMTDSRAILPLADDAGTTQTAARVFWRIEYDPAKEYKFGDMVQVTTGTAPPQGIWIANDDVPIGGDQPEWPVNATWSLVAPGIGMFHFKDSTDCGKKKMQVAGFPPCVDDDTEDPCA